MRMCDSVCVWSLWTQTYCQTMSDISNIHIYIDLFITLFTIHHFLKQQLVIGVIN